MTNIDRCACGGRLVLEDGTEPEHADDGWNEVYQCNRCGREGLLSHDANTDTTIKTGVLRG